MSASGAGRVAALPLALLAGCRAQPASPPVAPPPAQTEQVEWRAIGRSVQGRELRSASFGAGEVVLVVAGIHGDEAAGTPLVERLARELLREPSWARGRRVLIVPNLNPDGLAAGRRHNARGVDLNRNFPAANHRAGDRGGQQPLSEPESQALFELLESERPARALSFHQPVAVLDWDGPAEALAHAMAANCALPARRIGSRPGSLGSYVGLELQVPIITVELRRADDDLDVDALWERYGAMLTAAVAWPGSPAP